MEKEKEEKQGATPDSVREQAAQFAVHREPVERIAALENERQHLATQADITKLEGHVDTKIAELKGEMDTSFADLEGKMNTRFGKLEGEMNTRFADLKGEMNTRLGKLEENVNAQAEAIRELGKMMRWIFGCTVALLVAVSASIAAALVSLLLG